MPDERCHFYKIMHLTTQNKLGSLIIKDLATISFSSLAC